MSTIAGGTRSAAGRRACLQLRVAILSPADAPSLSGRLCGRTARHDRPQHRVREVVLVDVADILNRFPSDNRRSSVFDVVKPDIRIEAVLDCVVAKLPEISRAGVVG